MIAPTLPWFELARFRRSRLTRVAIVAVTVVPLLYGALYIWANLDPTGNLDRVSAAIVNDDEVVQVPDRDGKDQPVAVGRQLAANLIGDDSSDNYDWRLTDASDAAKGLADGRYKAVLTIPKNLSAAATSTSGDPADAVQGRLDLQTNDAVNYINGTIAQTILAAARSSLNAQVTETYLDNVYLGFTDVRKALGEAAGGARDLGDGASELADGAGRLDDGASELASGLGTIDSGASQLADGLGTLDRRTAPLTGQSRRLADGARQVAAGNAEIAGVVKQVGDAILNATQDADTRIDELAAELDRLADQCEQNPPAPPSCQGLRDAADQADGLKAVVGDVRGDVSEAQDRTAELADGADRVADGTEQLARSVPRLVGAIGDASDGADRLAAGTGEAVDGANRLADGSAGLADGAQRLAEGAYQLQAGLTDGRDDVPDYADEKDREQLASTAASPIEEAADRLNGVGNYGSALAPYFMALALWVGAMAIYLLLRPLSARAIASTAGSVRTALAGFAPGALLSVVQAGLLVAVVEGVLGIHVERPLLLLGSALAAGIVFTALNQMFVALFGAAGRFLAIVFVCLQLTSAGGTYPIETAPGFFGLLHDLLPMTYVVDLFRAATSGGGSAITSDFVVLGVFTVAALAVTSFAAYRRQRITISRLHPTLVV